MARQASFCVTVFLWTHKTTEAALGWLKERRPTFLEGNKDLAQADEGKFRYINEESQVGIVNGGGKERKGSKLALH